MSAVIAPSVEPRAFDERRFLRNGRVPDSWLAEALARSANQVGAWYTKEICRFATPIANVVNPSGDADLWRHRWISGPYAQYAAFRAVMLLQSTADPLDSQIKWEIFDEDAAGASLTSISSSFGASPSGGAGTDTPAKMGIVSGVVSITADNNLSGMFSAINKARIVSVSAYEISLKPDTDNGYIGQGFSAGSPILDTDRSALANQINSLWKGGRAQLFNWSVPNQASPRTRTGTSNLNAVDATSTTVSASTPGFTIDLRNRNRLSASTVPVVFAAYAKHTSGSGSINLIDSGNVVVASLTINSSTAQWWTTTTNLPNTRAKYDLHLAGSAAQTCSLYAAGMYIYET